MPIYSTETEQSPSGFPESFVLNIRKLAFPHLLYLPSTKASKEKFNDNINEGIIRLDRIFSSLPHYKKITPTDIKISDDYLGILNLYLKEYLLKEQTKDLSDLKDLCQNHE